MSKSVKKGNAPAPAKKEFGSRTEYAPPSKTHVPTGGKKK